MLISDFKVAEGPAKNSPKSLRVKNFDRQYEKDEETLK
jgi:hypothetical protein